jgi:hypothetical protein
VKSWLLIQSQAPNPNAQFPSKSQIGKSKKSNYSIFKIIEVKMSISSRAWLGTLFHLRLGIWFVIWDLTIGIWDLLP